MRSQHQVALAHLKFLEAASVGDSDSIDQYGGGAAMTSDSGSDIEHDGGEKSGDIVSERGWPMPNWEAMS